MLASSKYRLPLILIDLTKRIIYCALHLLQGATIELAYPA
jgi:hypothetical protein